MERLLNGSKEKFSLTWLMLTPLTRLVDHTNQASGTDGRAQAPKTPGAACASSHDFYAWLGLSFSPVCGWVHVSA